MVRRILLVTAPLVLLMIVVGFWQRLDRPDLPVLQEPVYKGSEASKVVALAVNVDWGEEFLPEILETCQQNDFKLTFFVTGRWADKFPDLVRRMAEDGHEIGNHGFGHPHPDQLSVTQNLRDIQRAEAVIKKITSRRTTLFAPPYGERGTAVLQAADQAGYRTILWSVDTVDWKLRNADAIATRVINRVHPGAIVLMHPLEATSQALPVIIRELKKDGYALVPVGRLLAQAPVSEAESADDFKEVQ